MRTLYLKGTTIAAWPGVKVFQRRNGVFVDITAEWSWSETEHQHYEVRALDGGSYWVPASTNPPQVWGGSTKIEGTLPVGKQPVNHAGKEYRPDGTYIYIPNASIPINIVPGVTSNAVVCHPPANYPPLGADAISKKLGMIMAADPAAPTAFSDSDGLISFVNLSSDFVTSNPEFKTGRNVCDMIASFFSTTRVNIFGKMQSGQLPPLPGDSVPETQWDASVTHYIQYMLVEAGGLAEFKITTESYQEDVAVVDFSAEIVKLIMDAITDTPKAIADAATDFITGIAGSLRFSWHDKSKNFSTCLLGQCHEAVQIDATGKNFIYFPKVKYYYLSINASQQEFTSPCVNVEKIHFDFKFDSYVTALKASVLDETSDDHKSFVAFLQNAQNVNYQDAKNLLSGIMSGAKSAAPVSIGSANEFGVNLAEYPALVTAPAPTIQQVLNREIPV